MKKLIKAPTLNANASNNSDIITQDFLLDIMPTGNLTLCGFYPNKRQTPAKSFLMPDNADAAVAWAERQNTNGFNVYFSVNPTVLPVNKKPLKADIQHVTCAHLDIDPIDVLGISKSEFNSTSYGVGRQMLQDKLQYYIDEYTPSFIIDSGNGFQLFWILDEPVSIEEGERINKGLIQHIGGDTGTYNADRIMRLPGMKNYPTKTKLAKGYPEKPTDSKILYSSPDGSLPEIDYHDVVLQSLPPPSFNEDTSSLTDDEIKSLHTRFFSFMKTNLNFAKRYKGITDGLNDTSRSGIDMSLCAILKMNGFSYKEMKHLLIECEHGAGAEKDDRYFERMWQNSSTKQSPQEVISKIDAIIESNGEIGYEEWAKLISDAKLLPTEIDKVLVHLVDKKIGTKRNLKEELKIFENKSKMECAVDLLEQSRGNRVQIQWNELDLNGMLYLVEKGMLKVHGKYDLLHNNTLYVRVKITKPTGFHAIDAKNQSAPDTAIFVIYDQTAMLLRIEQSIQFIFNGKFGAMEIKVPDALPKHLLSNPQVLAPIVTGLINHPIVRPDGSVLTIHGYDKASSLYHNSGGVIYPKQIEKGLSKEACAFLIFCIFKVLFSEFEFSDEVDFSVAMAMLFTGIQRKILGIAPGFVGTAHTPGTGKTTLARVIYLVMTGCDMPVTSLSPDENEAKKEITTNLMEQIEMMCIDNESSGSTIKSPIMAKIVTASEFKGRILGYSKNATVRTNVLLVYTGNNLQVNDDMARRMLFCYLDSKHERPAEREFKHPDVVSYVQSVRVDILHTVTTIIRSYLLSGESVNLTPSGYPLWDEMVREPLVWAGMIDPMDSCDRTREESPDVQGPIALINAIDVMVSNTDFTATGLANMMTSGVGAGTTGTAAFKLNQVFDEYFPMHKRDARGIGNVLKKVVGRRISGRIITKRMLHGITHYSIT